MANEWVKVELYGQNNDGDARRFTIANGDAVSKGTLLALSDPRTVTSTTVSGSMIAGVAAEDHAANVGETSITVWTNGIFDVVAADTITAGMSVCSANSTDNANQVVATVDLAVDDWGASGAAILGYAMETASAAEKVNVRLRL